VSWKWITCCFMVTLLLPLKAKVARKEQGSARKSTQAVAKLELRPERSSPLDLEVSGNLAGHRPSGKYYLSREDLRRLPGVNFMVIDDPNFKGPTKVQGVQLETLAREFAEEKGKSLIVAVCDDFYRTYSSQRYRELHQPVLALELDGKAPEGWPKSKDGVSMIPYLITHQAFVAAGRILSQPEEELVPWGVIRLEFRNEKTAFAAITPHGTNVGDSVVQAGYGIARQNCLRCHGPESEGPLKGKLTWEGIAVFAAQAPKRFAAYVRDPKAQAKDAQMPGNPEYDGETMDALIAYFRTFASKAKP
jgi:mono/diheme cytochrome c family protein